MRHEICRLAEDQNDTVNEMLVWIPHHLFTDILRRLCVDVFFLPPSEAFSSYVLCEAVGLIGIHSNPHPPHPSPPPPKKMLHCRGDGGGEGGALKASASGYSRQRPVSSSQATVDWAAGCFKGSRRSLVCSLAEMSREERQLCTTTQAC